MKRKRKLVKIRQFLESIFIPGTLNLLIYFIALVVCVRLGIRFNSPLQLGFIAVVTIILTWEILFRCTQYVVTKFLTLRLEKIIENFLTGIIVCFVVFLYILVSALYILKDILITILLVLLTCFRWIFIFFEWPKKCKQTRWLLYTCIFVF